MNGDAAADAAAASWWSLATLLDAMAFVGILLLAVPVVVLDLNKKAAFEARRRADRAEARAAARDVGPDLTPRTFVATLFGDDKDAKARAVNDWVWWQRACLWTGYLGLLGSALLRLVLP